jgi:hypothetical protein
MLRLDEILNHWDENVNSGYEILNLAARADPL